MASSMHDPFTAHTTLLMGPRNPERHASAHKRYAPAPAFPPRTCLSRYRNPQATMRHSETLRRIPMPLPYSPPFPIPNPR